MSGPRHTAFALIPTALLAVLLVGCSTDFYRSETVLHSDGRIDRRIYQPADKTPETVLNSSAWAQTTFAPRIEPDEWQTSLAALPSAGRDEKHPYFAAGGRFASVQALPRHFVRKSPDGSREGTLQRSVARNDFVLVVEHVWNERLTDVVTLEDLHQARQELATLCIDLIEAVLNEGLDDEYDARRLIDWLRGEGTVWFGELTDVYYDAAVRKQFAQPKVLQRRFEEVCRRHGVASVENSGVEEFAARKLRELLRKKDGNPPDESVVDAILVWIQLREPATIAGQPVRSPFEAVMKNVIDRKYGGDEAWQQRIAALAVRIVGLYGPLQAPEEFHYTHEMPGTIIETNGTLLADNRVEWSFRAAEAYPLGYLMTCRSLEADADLQKRLFDGLPLASRAAQLAYVKLLREHPALQEVLSQCEEHDSLRPLDEYRATIELTTDETRKRALARLWALLQLPI